MTTKVKVRAVAERGPTGPLSQGEVIHFDELLAEIDRGMKAWRRIGEMLAEVQAHRLYRETHATFIEFVRDRWGWGERYTFRLMAAPKTASDFESRMAVVGDGSAPVFTSESAVRPMSGVHHEQIDAVSAYLVEHCPDGKITGRLAREAVDAVGQPLPPKAMSNIKIDIDELAHPFNELRCDALALGRRLNALAKSTAGSWLRATARDPQSGLIGPLAAALKTIREMIQYATPHQACEKCSATGAFDNDNCPLCHGLNWVPKGSE